MKFYEHAGLNKHDSTKHDLRYSSHKLYDVSKLIHRIFKLLRGNSGPIPGLRYTQSK
jgi:hypothetical protein